MEGGGWRGTSPPSHCIQPWSAIIATNYSPSYLQVFGGTLTLAGFPAWAVRSSELFDVGQLGALTGSKLDGVLRRFLGTRQRFGR